MSELYYYPVYDTSDWQSYADEQMGTKQKMWLCNPSGDQYLFKYPRPGFGEAWAEKAAAEIAAILGIPHAQVELAVFHDQQGTICRTFMEGQKGDLYHGNQLLEIALPNYDGKKNFGQSQHTCNRVFDIIRALDATAPESIDFNINDSGVACFAGYLVLDALISNTDRHHENWALIVTFYRNEDGSSAIENVKIAPTFDHASSLGRELSDEDKVMRLKNSVAMEAYCARCPSRLYWNESDSKPLHPMELVKRAAQDSPSLFKPWLDRLGKTNPNEISAVFYNFPSGWISPESSEFADALINNNRRKLEEIYGGLP